jgi:hypothetical protein
MTRDEQRKILASASPDARPHEVECYLSALHDWLACDANVREHGPVSLHPRTGAPFDNPYVAARKRAMDDMRSCKAVKADRLWAALRAAR